MTPARSKMVKLILRVSPSAARDIDAFLQKDAWGSRGSVVREALLSFFRHDFDDPFPLGSGHADFPEHWGRLLPRPAPDTSVKEVKEPLSIRITVRLPRDFVSRVDVAAKRHNFDNRTEFIRAILVTYLSWRSPHPDTLTKPVVVLPAVVSLGSSFSLSPGENARSEG